MTSDQQSVLNVVEGMTAAFHEGDIEGVMASYQEAATVLFEPGGPVSDREAIRQRFQELFVLKPRFTYRGHEVIVEDDVAIHIAPWKMMAKTPDGESIEQAGLSVAVMRKQPDGSWLMVIDNPHSDHLMGGE